MKIASSENCWADSCCIIRPLIEFSKIYELFTLQFWWTRLAKSCLSCSIKVDQIHPRWPRALISVWSLIVSHASLRNLQFETAHRLLDTFSVINLILPHIIPRHGHRFGQLEQGFPQRLLDHWSEKSKHVKHPAVLINWATWNLPLLQVFSILLYDSPPGLEPVDHRLEAIVGSDVLVLPKE